ncbi:MULTISPECIES: site-specific integrase [Cecembia]|uniref:Site-specific recombinase XerD n=2 Tax=Cecembia TaxID=1187078 RepID=A0A4Q7P6F8_9BACT|nr:MULTISPECIES: site-specific integrase [Cecembia]PSL03033.1 site-specific recombinase XerD [Cecembia rubra]RZS95357.1 site-specific recombinase XerD [Cecembia calidifontis]
MANFNYYLREKSKDGDTPVLLFISYHGHRLKYSTGKSIHPKFWNEDSQLARLVKEFPNAKKFNDRLKFIKGEAEKTLMGMEADLNRIPSTIELKTKLDEVLKEIPEAEKEDPDRMPTFMELFDRYIQEAKEGTRLTASGKRFDKRSIQKYNTVYDTLEKFGKSYHLTFDTIDKNFYTKFVTYLNKEISKTVNGKKVIIKPSYTVNTIGKYIQVIKTFLAYATENGYNRNMAFQKFKAHNTPGFSIYLNEDEINQIMELDLRSTPHLERVRDLFIVGCWTGLRFSDFTAIRPENIKDEYLEIKTFKTGEKVIIPIHSMVRKIMAKYDGVYPNSLPPAISNQKMNAYLKDIAKQVDCLKTPVEVERIKGGLKAITRQEKWELVTTHTARRSFATNVYKSGFPAISLMKITGHRTEKAFLLYIKVTPEENAKQLLDHWRKTALKVG